MFYKKAQLYYLTIPRTATPSFEDQAAKIIIYGKTPNPEQPCQIFNIKGRIIAVG